MYMYTDYMFLYALDMDNYYQSTNKQMTMYNVLSNLCANKYSKEAMCLVRDNIYKLFAEIIDSKHY